MENFISKGDESSFVCPIHFILHGIACQCLTLLSSLGILEKLTEKQFISEETIQTHPHSKAILAAFMTLTSCHILEKQHISYQITAYGEKISKYIGLNNLLFYGYGNLMANQVDLVKGSIKHPKKLINEEQVAIASIDFGRETVDPIIFKEFSKLAYKGTICDLGCGAGTRLFDLCKRCNRPGLGIDSEEKAIVMAKKTIQKLNISIIQGDISQLKDIWRDVTTLMQCFVFHDFDNDNHCLKILNSYRKHFPNLQHFFFVDIVSASQSSIMPGFDYVHGLLNIQTRSYKKTINLFSQSKFHILKEIPIKGLPNTFLWKLAP